MFIVVLTSACPSSSCTSFGAAPLESRLLVNVQAFMKTYRKAEAIVTQYNQDLAEWEQAVKNGRKPAEKQHRPPERQSVRNRLRQLQEEGKQNAQPKQRKKSQDRDR